MVELKKQLIEQIQNSTDQELLEDVHRLLAQNGDEQEVMSLTEDQISAITEGQEQIKAGQYVTHEQASETIEKWLKSN